MMTMWTFLFGMFFGGVMYWVWAEKLFPALYPYLVIIMEKRENGLFPIIKYGKMIEQKGRRKLKFFMGKGIGEIPYEHIKLLAGNKRAGLIQLFSPNKGEYHATSFDEGDGIMRIITTDQRLINLYEMEDEIQRYTKPNKLEIWMPVIALSVVIIVTVIIGVYGWSSIVEMQQGNQGVLAQQQEFNQRLMNIFESTNSNAPATPSPP